jgi:hypothetical protein
VRILCDMLWWEAGSALDSRVGGSQRMEGGREEERRFLLRRRLLLVPLHVVASCSAGDTASRSAFSLSEL